MESGRRSRRAQLARAKNKGGARLGGATDSGPIISSYTSPNCASSASTGAAGCRMHDAACAALQLSAAYQGQGDGVESHAGSTLRSNSSRGNLLTASGLRIVWPRLAGLCS